MTVEISKTLTHMKIMMSTGFGLIPMPHGYAHIYIGNDIRNLYDNFDKREMREYFTMFVESGIDVKYLQSFIHKAYPHHVDLLDKMLVLM